METKKTNIPLIAGIAFIVAAVFRLFGGMISIWAVLQLVGYGVLAFALLTKRRGILLAVGFGVQAVLLLIDFIGWRSIYVLVMFLAVLCAAFLCVVYCTEYLPKYRETLCKIWFVPACVYGAGSLMVRFNLVNLGYVCGLLFCLAWVVYPDGVPKAKWMEQMANVKTAAAFAKEDGAESKLFRKKAMCMMLIAMGIALIGCLFVFDWHTFDIAIVFFSVAGAVFVLAVDYLFAKEFEFVAIEKGYCDKAYFWYTFIFGPAGMLLVIALPKRTCKSNE